MKPTVHIPVMPQEALDWLDARPGGRYIDATFGGGGHTGLILQRGGTVLGIDRDPEALARGAERFKTEINGDRLRLAHSNHGNIRKVAERENFTRVDGVLMDLGVSSDQLDDASRGFSFSHDGPLDLRMDNTFGFNAADVIARDSEYELADIFKSYGEEPRAKLFARAIVRAREQSPVKTTAQLAAIILKAAGGRRGLATHPATRVFQALRYWVNQEMEDFSCALEDGLGLLAPNGRMVVITFESLTDRVAKQAFLRHAGKHVSLQQGGSKWEGMLPAVERLTRRAAAPSETECRANPRARSAKLRAVRRLDDAETKNLFEGKQGV